MIFIHDTFTATDGTLLESHLGETGHGWIKNSSASHAGTQEVFNNRAAPGNSFLLAGIPIAGDEYDLAADMYARSTISFTSQIVFQSSTTGLATYSICRNSSNVQLRRYSPEGSLYVLSSVSVAGWQAGTTESFTIEVRGAEKKVFRNGTQLISTTDSVISGPGQGYVGIRDLGGSRTVGRNYDNFIAASPGSIPTEPTRTFWSFSQIVE